MIDRELLYSGLVFEMESEIFEIVFWGNDPTLLQLIGYTDSWGKFKAKNLHYTFISKWAFIEQAPNLKIQRLSKQLSLEWDERDKLLKSKLCLKNDIIADALDTFFQTYTKYTELKA